MRRVRQVTSLLFLGAGVFMVIGGYSLGLRGLYGPGIGFPAFWVGLPLSVLSAVWFAQITFERAERAERTRFLSDYRGLVRLGSVVLALVAFTLLLKPLGFNLTMLALLLFLFFANNREHPVAKLIIAVLGSFGVHFVFEQFLRVPLPYASIGLLRAMGL